MNGDGRPVPRVSHRVSASPYAQTVNVLVAFLRLVVGVAVAALARAGRAGGFCWPPAALAATCRSPRILLPSRLGHLIRALCASLEFANQVLDGRHGDRFSISGILQWHARVTPIALYEQRQLAGPGVRHGIQHGDARRMRREGSCCSAQVIDGL